MATIEPIAKAGKVVLYIQTGVNTAGNPITSSRTFANVQSYADDQEIYDVAIALSQLMQHELVDVSRIEISNLVATAP